MSLTLWVLPSSHVAGKAQTRLVGYKMGVTIVQKDEQWTGRSEGVGQNIDHID